MHNPLLAGVLCGALALTAIRCAAADGLSAPEGQAITWIELQPKAIGDNETERIEDGRVYNVRNPAIAVFRPEAGGAPHAAVVVCPGGGYARLAIDKEGYAVARWLNALGIHAYVLKYRLKEFGYPAPLQDVTLAMRHLRANAAGQGIDPDRIGVMGFSAGGHVAAMAATLFDSPDALTGGALDQVSARPDFCILAYPVITMTSDLKHRGSCANLLGPDPDPGRIVALSLENRVTAATPPVFLFHGANDTSVPVDNSINFAKALHQAGCEVSLHVFADAPHGMALQPGHGPASGWPALLAAWLSDKGLTAPIPAPVAQ